MVDDIKSLKLKSAQQSHCFKFVGILLRDSFQNFRDLTSPTPKPQTYLTKTFDVYYYKWLNQLLSNNIVIRSDYYSHENNICYKYSVSPIYFSSSKSLYTLCNQKECKPLLTVEYKDIVKNITIKDRKYHNMFSDDILSLNIDYERLLKIVENRVNSLTISEFEINGAIRESVIKIHVPSGKPYYIKTGDAIAKAKSLGKSLINDNGIYRIENEIEFINHKKESINFSYINSIERLKQNNLYAKRNGTNSRLDTNFTSMCSLLVDDICEQNGLVQIDLKNSQFAILSYLLKNELNTDDYKQFKTLSVNGKLYGYIAKKLDLNERKKAKNTMFEIMFSSQKNSTTGKTKIKELFPTIVKWIDDYKKQNGDSQFSIMLQKKESEIFIDTILEKIKSKKLFCLTKHDSVIVREKDSLKIQEMIQDSFNEIGMEGELEITNTNKIMVKNDSQLEVNELNLTIRLDNFISNCKYKFGSYVDDKRFDTLKKELEEIWELKFMKDVTEEIKNYINTQIDYPNEDGYYVKLQLLK